MAHNRKKNNISRRMRSRGNQGIALLELILAISVGVMVSIAVTTVMLMGLRMFNRSNEAARHRNEVLTGITIMENLVAEGSGFAISEGMGTLEISCDAKTVLTYNVLEKAVYSGTDTKAAPILEHVEQFQPTMPADSLMRVFMTVRGEEYSFFLFARDSAARIGTASQGAEAFLAVLASQLGTAENLNDGFIMKDGVRTEVRYATWYNSAWGAEAAWCSCFVSWGLDQVGGYILGTTPRFASVNDFRNSLVSSGMWEGRGYVPCPGDLIFFNWDDGLLDHVGVVEKVENGCVYTIEGNSGGSGNNNGWVRRKVYNLTSSSIAGFGKINWMTEATIG